MVRIRIKRLQRHGDTLINTVVAPSNDHWLWLGAGLLALTLHGGSIALAVRVALPIEAADRGMAILEVRLELAGLNRNAAELPPDPVATSVVAVEKASDDPTKPLKAERTETTDPNLTISREAMHIPHKDGTRDEANNEVLSREAVAPNVSYAPRSDTKEASHPAAPMLEMGDRARRVRSKWEKQLLAHLARHKRYPKKAAQPSGEVILAFVLDRAGHIVRSTVLKGSGDTAFDQAALAMMQRSNPVPPPPPLIADGGLSFTMPVFFLSKQTKR